jgi:hypothetical protein
MFKIKYLIKKNYMQIYVYLCQTQKEGALVIYKKYYYKNYFNWKALCFFVSEFLYDSGLLKWKSKK